MEAQEMPLEHLALEATVACILESQGTITIREAEYHLQGSIQIKN